MMLTLVKPAFEDLWFKEKLMADEETMAYNARWGGTIPFPEDMWESWYESWVRNPGGNRYYRYLVNPDNEYESRIWNGCIAAIMHSCKKQRHFCAS